MRIVATLGGNALLERGQPPDAATQRANVRRAVSALARLAAEHELVLVHGNGPQVGLLALEREAGTLTGPYPLDVLDAETEGMIGYFIQQELDNVLPRERRAVALLTQVEVAADDAAFRHPDKPIGPVYSRAEGEDRARRHGWTVIADGAHWRRAVPSPAPRRIVELDIIRLLLGCGVVVICAGGGGIPVVRLANGALRGVEAVIDKDHASALLARELTADALLLLTDVDGVYADWGTPRARCWRSVGVETLATHRFAAGSMAPKVAAACAFVTARGGLAAIGSLAAAPDLLAGTAGTRILPSASPPVWWD